MRGNRRTPAGLLGALACIVAVEATLQEFAGSIDTVAEGWRQSAAAATSADVRRCAILCLGDSQVQVGLQPRVLEARLNQGVYNLAVVAGQATSTYFLLRRALEAGARPRAVVVDYNPGLMLNAPTFDLDHWTDLLDAREALELLSATRDPEFAAGLFLRRVFYSLKERDAFRAWILATIRGERMDPRADALAHRRNIERNRGALLKPVPPAPAPFCDYGDQFRPGFDWTCDGVNQAYIYKLLDTLAARGVPIFLVLPPCRLDLQSYLDRFGYHDRMDRALRMLLTRYPNLHIVDGRHSGYADDFVDPTHLDRRGALAFSTGVAEVLRRSFAADPPADRWIKLPDYRPVADRTDLEDLSQSLIAVRGAGARRQ